MTTAAVWLQLYYKNVLLLPTIYARCKYIQLQVVRQSHLVQTPCEKGRNPHIHIVLSLPPFVDARSNRSASSRRTGNTRRKG